MTRTSIGAAAWTAGIGLVLALVGGDVASAAPEEVQVYLDDMSAPGHFGLDVHTNLVATGGGAFDYVGQQESGRRLRITPEFAYGLSPNLEAGLYLPLATIDRTGRFGFDGAKVRLKFIAPRTEAQSVFWGANFEIGKVSHRLDENPWNAEFKGIVGRRWGRWTFGLNTNIDFTVSGPVATPASLELATSVSYALNKSLSLGFENYNGLGDLKTLGRFPHSEHSSFFTVDKAFGKWDIAVSVGAGYGNNRDGLIFKAIIGVPID